MNGRSLALLAQLCNEADAFFDTDEEGAEHVVRTLESWAAQGDMDASDALRLLKLRALS